MILRICQPPNTKFLIKEGKIMNNSQEILNILLQNIQRKGITEKACLNECNINTSFLTDWKNGRLKNPSYDKIVKISVFLNLDLNYVFGKISDSPSGREKELIRLFRLLPEEQQYRLLGRAELLAEQNEISER